MSTSNLNVIFTRRSLLVSATLLASRAFAQAPRLRPGCQANAWNLDPQRFDLLLTALAEIKELGFEGFETNIRFLQPQLPHLDQARRQIEASGLVFIGAHTSLPANVQDLAQIAADARKFGAHSLVVSHPGLSKTGEFSPSALDQKARALNQAGQICNDAGLVLAYHNHEPEFQNHAAEMSGLLRQTDPKLVSQMLDIGHAWIADPDAVRFFEEHHARVWALHVRDYHNKVSVPLGQGEFPLKDLNAAILKTGWKGWLIDEEERPTLPVKPGKAATGPSRKTMREVFGV